MRGLVVLSGILNTMVGLATPFLYAALGETFTQTSGVVNLGVDGVMLLSAFAAFYVALSSGSLVLGLLAAVIVGLAMGLLMSLISVTLKAEQGVSGIGLYMFGLGMSSLLFKVLIGTVKTVEGFKSVAIPLLSDIPFIGSILFRNDVLTYGAFLLVPASWWLLEKTSFGLKLKAVGQNPAAADSVGISVGVVRYIAVCLGSVLAGVAGIPLHRPAQSLPGQPHRRPGLHRRGPRLLRGVEARRVLAGALLFSVANSVQLWMQVLGVKLPSSIAVMLPYLLTILALTVTSNRARQPAALNKPFERGESLF